MPVFQWISSTAVFLALYSLPPNCVSRGADISLPKHVNQGVSGLVPPEWLQGNTWDHPRAIGTPMDKPACCVSLTGSSVPWREGEKHNSKMRRIRLPFSPLVSRWFLLYRNTKTKGRISPRVSTRDQIHPDTKREQFPSGAVPTYSLSGGFPSCTICSQVWQCAVFLLFWHHFWDWETRNLLIFWHKKNPKIKCIPVSCKQEWRWTHFAFPISMCPLASAKAGGAMGTGSAREEQPQQCRRVAVLPSQWQGRCWLLLIPSFCQGTVWLRDSTEMGCAGKAGFLQQQQEWACGDTASYSLSCCFQLEDCQGNSHRYQITAKNLQAYVGAEIGHGVENENPWSWLSSLKGNKYFPYKILHRNALCYL